MSRRIEKEKRNSKKGLLVFMGIEKKILNGSDKSGKTQ